MLVSGVALKRAAVEEGDANQLQSIVNLTRTKERVEIIGHIVPLRKRFGIWGHKLNFLPLLCLWFHARFHNVFKHHWFKNDELKIDNEA
ncbi:unnamed protein product [Fusarium graminearum]|uniref:Uncharacterized protein n=1 Tax=Gibberella zeae TaxID=5518 RepID=A0A679NXC4_GIBZA|nr:unnamed protein product [Fusarium graminearum]CAG1990117.1 unnamed protein product [Fusarium graminearum]CAG2003192.1 unnamed protein product [Fusarium graminearum]CZS81622.1 unnamed protein product [Fusarium graminearum]